MLKKVLTGAFIRAGSDRINSLYYYSETGILTRNLIAAEAVPANAVLFIDKLDYTFFSSEPAIGKSAMGRVVDAQLLSSI
jgi:hypothetical protein